MTRAPVAAALTWAACLLVATFLGACSGQAVTSGAGDDAAPDSSAAAAQSANPGATPSAGAGGGSDWAHVLQVVAALKAQPPAEPVVCLLGGSAARESTIDDASWAARVKQLGGPTVAAYNLGSRNRTLAQDIELIRALPKTPGIVYIGINVGRFTAPPAHPTIDLPEPAQSLPPYRQHQYSQSRILGDARKRALLAKWLAERYPLFVKNYATSLQALDKLVAVCESRGLHPVLLELPRNQELIGRALDAPVARFTTSCRALARKRDVPWLSFVSTARLPNADFYDLWHLVEPGRAVWQRLLSEKTVALLERYGLEGPAPTPAASPQATESPAP
ncbi:MAG: hypothetical protein NTX16_05445 [Actinobacteria bacterium]|nr:hypothetical protein [Actinomycetota bacterium]